MPENFELLETGQIEVMHEQVHSRLDKDADCDALRMQHDSLAAELVKRGITHDTEIICPESELGQKAPNYRRGFTDDVCTQCAFGQLFPYCNLYKADYAKGFTCDSFRYFEVLELEPPHGFLMAKAKKTAIALDKPLERKSSQVRVIVSNGEAFGIATLDEPAQIKIKEFDSEEFLSQHRITPRERRQWWPDVKSFYVYRIKKWCPYEGVKLYENGKVVNEPRLTSEQWQIISKAKELPKQITLVEDALNITLDYKFITNEEVRELFAKPLTYDVDQVLKATFEVERLNYKSEINNEQIPIYSLALVRNPRMRVSKKSLKQEGEDMPFKIRKRDDEYCVVKINADGSDGDISGCHDTEEEAEAQLAALRINVEAEEKENTIHSDKSREKEFEWPAEMFQTATQEISPKEVKKVGFIESLQKLSKGIVDFLKHAETEENEVKLFANETGIAQKMVKGELWHVAWATNAFKDRDEEIFSTKSLENYVLENEKRDNRGFFNYWHINEEDGNFNSDFAKKEWQGVSGRFLVEAGPYLKDKKGHAAAKFFNKYADGHPKYAPEGWGCSIEYKYLPEERMTGIYENIWITRTSTLPRMIAANIWTEAKQLRGIKMALTEDQKDSAIELFGKEYVNRFIVDEGEKRTAELEGEVDHKVKKDDPEPQQINIEELAAEVGKQFTANLTPIAEAMTTMATELKELKEWKEKQDKTQSVKDKTETPRFVFNMQRASEQDETIVTEDDGLKGKKPKETQVKDGDPWSQMFNE
jgi:hypothetical protein